MLCNHFRSFEYIAEDIKKFFGDNTDFYICTWDVDNRYMTALDMVEEGFLKDQQNKIQFTSLPKVYTPLNLEHIENFIKDFNPKQYKILPHKYGEDWVNQIPNLNKLGDSYTKLAHVGQFIPIEECANMIKASGITYDVVFRLRMDTIPLNLSFKTLEEILNHRTIVNKTDTIFMNKLGIKNGLVQVADRFFYGPQDIMLEVFSNLKEKINFLFSTPLAPLVKDKLVFAHKLQGLLLLLTNVYIRSTPLLDKIVRKDFVNMKLNPTNFLDHDKYDLYRKSIEKKYNLTPDK